MKKPLWKKTIYIVDNGDNYDVIAGYDVEDLADENDEPLKDGHLVAIYELVEVKKYRTNPRLE